MFPEPPAPADEPEEPPPPEPPLAPAESLAPAAPPPAEVIVVNPVPDIDEFEPELNLPNMFE